MSRTFYLFAFLVSIWTSALGQAWKIAVPEATHISQGHLIYPSPAVSGHTHFGVDVMALCGKDVYPLANGFVVNIATGYAGGLGNAIHIRYPKLGANGSDLYAINLHLQDPPSINGKPLQKGDSVYSGIPVGKIGDTGFANGDCHTHFEIRNFYYPDIAGDGWYHPNSKRCSDDSLNIYACGDQRNASWAINDWENPETYQVQQNRCDPTKQRCAIRVYDTIGWFPPVDDCSQASQWFLMGIVNGEKTTVGTTTSAACPQACVISN